VFLAIVVALDLIGREDIGIAGGKGASLGEMIRAGLPVPAGMVVTAAAYREFLDTTGLKSRIEALLTKSDPDAVSDNIREEFERTAMPEKTASEILAAVQDIPGPVAIRSSATAEDLPSVSFAGQHETHLFVTGRDAIVSSIKKCWSSLWTGRAISYRTKNNIDHFNVLMAVVIQEMADADVSGVMFTANPVTGDRDEIVIEAGYGLGEGLVSGKVSPDRFVVNRAPGLKITGKELGTKGIEILRAQDGGTLGKEVSPERSRRLCLSDEEILKLASLGLRIEGHYGYPQDIEWCLSGGRVSVVQSRPVTTLGKTGIKVYFASKKNKEALKGKLIVWSNWNTRETMPMPQTPFGWSFWNSLVLPAAMEHALGIRKDHPDFEQHLALDRVEGRLYFNMNVFLGMPLLGGIFSRLLKFMDLETAVVMEGLIKSGEFEPLKFPHRWRSYLDALTAYVKGILQLPQTIRVLSVENARRVYDEVERDAKQRLNRDLSGMNDGDIFKEAGHMIDQTIMKVWPTFVWYGFGFLGYDIAKFSVRKWPEIHTENFLAGLLPANKTTETALEIWKLTEGAPESVRRVFLESDLNQILEKLEGFIEGKEFLKRLKIFLDSYGHRSAMEFDVTVPRWKEEPDFVLQMLKNYFSHKPGDLNPPEHFQKQVKERQALIQLARKRLSKGFFNRIFPLRRWLFEWGLRILRDFYPFRENAKFYIMMVWQRAREMYLEVGKRFKATGLLDDEKDLFYISFPEIERISRGEWRNVTEIRKRIEDRKAEIEKWRSFNPPLIIRSDGKKVGVEQQISRDVLRGAPASHGRIKARARVIMDPSRGAGMEKGEILVAPFTDPGWTPLFLTAGGLVMEIGGMMSHGAVVAREYGIPAVVGVKGATQTIKNGDVIEVDGGAGEVRIAATEKS
jgi:pyruvate,water dikinase